MSTVVNWDAAKNDPFPKDDYLAKFTGRSDKKIGPKSEYYTLEFTVIDPKAPRENHKVWQNYPVSGNALWRLRQDMISMGAAPEMMSRKESNLEDDVDSLLEAEVILSLDINEYEGKVNNKIVSLKAANSLASSGRARRS